ncbi:hypothetical protein [Bacillus tropicus]|nr:hypothetical protein [Bacillus tropicus]
MNYEKQPFHERMAVFLERNLKPLNCMRSSGYHFVIVLSRINGQ